MVGVSMTRSGTGISTTEADNYFLRFFSIWKVKKERKENIQKGKGEAERERPCHHWFSLQMATTARAPQWLLKASLVEPPAFVFPGQSAEAEWAAVESGLNWESNMR